MKFILTLIAALALSTASFSTAYAVTDIGSADIDGVDDTTKDETGPTDLGDIDPEPCTDCEGPTKPTDPIKPVEEEVHEGGEGRDESPATPPQHWTGTCEYDAVTNTVRVHTAFLRNPKIAGEQCVEHLRAKGVLK